MEQKQMNREAQAMEVPDNLADVSIHIEKVLEAAQRTAADTVEQARAEGERRIGAAKKRAQESVDERNARIREISDDLLRQAEAIEGRLSKLDSLLATALEELRRELERLPEPPADDFADDEGIERDDSAGLPAGRSILWPSSISSALSGLSSSAVASSRRAARRSLRICSSAKK